jgi:hypothetical protein
MKNDIPKNETKSQDTALETWLSAHLQDLESERPDGDSLHKGGREASKRSQNARQDAQAQYGG